MAAQAAVRRSLAKRVPLYAFAQLDSGSRGSVAADCSGSSGSSSALACKKAVGAKEREALRWYGTLSAQGRAPAAGRVKKVSSAQDRAGNAVRRHVHLGV